MKTGYFDAKYYSINQMTKELHTDRPRLLAAMDLSDFPHHDLKIGLMRLWSKEKVEPLLPGLTLLLGESLQSRRRTILVMLIQKFIYSHELSEQQIYELEEVFKREYNVKSYTIRHYGGWIHLVTKAFQENKEIKKRPEETIRT